MEQWVCDIIDFKMLNSEYFPQLKNVRKNPPLKTGGFLIHLKRGFLKDRQPLTSAHFLLFIF